MGKHHHSPVWSPGHKAAPSSSMQHPLGVGHPELKHCSMQRELNWHMCHCASPCLLRRVNSPFSPLQSTEALKSRGLQACRAVMDEHIFQTQAPRTWHVHFLTSSSHSLPQQTASVWPGDAFPIHSCSSLNKDDRSSGPTLAPLPRKEEFSHWEENEMFHFLCFSGRASRHK